MTPVMPELRDAVLGSAGALIELRRDLHRHPELSFAERRTAALVADRLHRAGLEVITGVAGTGVVGVLRGDRPGRTVAWRADMDALPIDEAVDGPFRSTAAGVMHACGHDGHTAIAVVLAELLAGRRASLPGTAVFVFQPAEEVFGGARPMLETGLLDRHRVDEVYGLHLTSRLAVGRVEACPGVSMASADVLEIEVRGCGGHAATPQLTVDPIAIASQILIGLRPMVSAVVPPERLALLTIGQFAAGTAPNIIPELATMRGSLRALHADDRRAVLERLAEHVAAIASGHGARAAIRAIGAGCPMLVNHDRETARVHACASAELGAAEVAAGAPVLASDDMALFLEQRPGCYFRIGAAPGHRAPPPHHSAEFEIDEDGLVVAARIAAAVIVDALAG